MFVKVRVLLIPVKRFYFVPQILNAVPLSGLQLEPQLKALLAVLVWNAAVTQLLVSVWLCVCVCVCVLPNLIEQTLVWNVLRDGGSTRL